MSNDEFDGLVDMISHKNKQAQFNRERDARLKENNPVKFSELAQTAARAALRNQVTDPEKILLSLFPFMEQNDIYGSTLVLSAGVKAGCLFTALVKFARDQRHDKKFGPLLDWVKDCVNPTKQDSDYQSRAVTLACNDWFNENL